MRCLDFDKVTVFSLLKLCNKSVILWAGPCRNMVFREALNLCCKANGESNTKPARQQYVGDCLQERGALAGHL